MTNGSAISSFPKQYCDFFSGNLLGFIPKLQKKLSGKGKAAEEKKETPVQAAPAPAVSAPQAAGTDDGELAAVIAAAIAASEGTSTDGFVVRSIKRRKSNKWN